MPNTILAATTDATQSGEVIVDKDTSPVSFYCPGIAGAEAGDLQYKDAGGSWHDYYKDGSQEQVTATNSEVTVYAMGIFRINKDATAGATSVEVSTNKKP
jgi:hypothetical protein